MMKNILCVDDVEANIFTVKSVLESSKNVSYNIFTALSAQAGLDILIKEKIDLILLDIMMPEVDGFMMAKIIKSNKKTKNIPIIFVTAKTDDSTIQQCYEVGGSDYISKPFNSIELISRIGFHLKLKEKESLIQKEKEYTQSVLDLQDNFIVVTDANKAVNVNKAALEFFGFKSLSEFHSKYGCICDTFVREEGYFHLGLVNEQLFWVEDILKRLQNSDVLVKIINPLNKSHIFAIKATKFYDLYIVTLTDITDISEKSKEFEHNANFDSLTQIYNRNMFYCIVDKKIHRARLPKDSMTFVIFDIDYFKRVNDTYGHLAGDEVLKHLTSMIKKHIRSSDVFARWGGEEFVLAIDVGLKKGLEIVEHLRALVEKEKFDTIGNITCSFGVTELKSNDTVETITARADKALYEAKESGRNKVCQF